MSTNRCVARSISVGAPPEAVLGFLSDPGALPRWAPGFAERVRRVDGDRWTLGADGREFEIRTRVSAPARTVDFLATTEERGVFARVLPNGDGSEVLLALVLSAGADAAGGEQA